MKMLVVNRKIVGEIVAVMLLICGLQSASYAVVC